MNFGLIVFIGYVVAMVIAFVCAAFDNGGNSWVKQDGTIIEWSPLGVTIVHPDGTVEHHPTEKDNG